MASFYLFNFKYNAQNNMANKKRFINKKLLILYVENLFLALSEDANKSSKLF